MAAAGSIEDLAIGFKRIGRANPEVGHIRVVTSRLVEVGLKPDKSQSSPFALNKKIPFGITNNTKVL